METDTTAEDDYREHLRIENPEDPYNGNPEEKYVMRKPHLNTLTREQKLKLFEFIGEKFWNMRPKQLQEMEDEFGEDGLMKCFNELRDFLLDEEDDYFSPSDDEEVDQGIIRRVLMVCNLSYDMGKDELKNNVACLLNLSCKEDMNDYIYKLEKQKEEEDIGMVKECYKCREKVNECNWYEPDDPMVSNSKISCYGCVATPQ